MNDDEARRIAIIAKLDQGLAPVFASVAKMTEQVGQMLVENHQDTSATYSELVVAIVRKSDHHESAALAAAALVKLAQVSRD